MRTYIRSHAKGGTYFFTVNLAQRKNNDLLVRHIEELRNACRYTKRCHPMAIEAMVVLPEHLHCIWRLPEGDDDYLLRWRLLKSHFSRQIEKGETVFDSRLRKNERGIWQRRYWEHQIRDETDYQRHLDYIHYNPVKHGYVAKAEDWRYSSIHRWIKLGIYNENWAALPDTIEKNGNDRWVSRCSTQPTVLIDQIIIEGSFEIVVNRTNSCYQDTTQQCDPKLCMTNDSTKLEELFFSEEFQCLCEHENRFNLFRVMRIQHKELIHSNIIAELLNPVGSHGMRNAFLNSFLKELGRCGVSDEKYKDMEIPLTKIISILDADACVIRELDFIDLVVEFPEKHVVFGIENKVWSKERTDQLKDYQSALIKRYPNHVKSIVFLTPSGKKPETDDIATGIPVYCMSYQNIANFLKKSKTNAAQSASYFLDQFIDHLENYMAGNDEVKDLCWEIFQKYPEAYERMSNNIDYCKSRRIYEFFELIAHRLKNDYGLMPCVDNNPNSHLKFKNDCEYDLDVRKESWPENVWVKFYKHNWFGVFPYIKKTSSAVTEYFGIESPYVVANWGEDNYYFIGRSLNKERMVKANGNAMDETNIREAFDKFNRFVEEIDSAVEKNKEKLKNKHAIS